jgi:methenyltetrahydromethanopterin cyclohydrolase
MNLNQESVRIAKRMIAEEQDLRIKVTEVAGATVLDCGVRVPGSFEAGRLFVQACMGGLAEVGFHLGEPGLPWVQVATSHPAIACIGSQKAGWMIKDGDFRALASGPGRILAGKPRETYEKLGYGETAEEALVALEADRDPPREVVRGIARECGVEEENLYILLARTASLVGSIQVSGRAAETALYRIDVLGHDIRKVGHVMAAAPVAPVVGDDAAMMGVANDMIIYGSRVYLSTTAELRVDEIPSVGSSAYGKPFGEIFKEAGHDFYRIDQGIFAPAEICVSNPSRGTIEKAGRVNLEVVKRSVGL